MWLMIPVTMSLAALLYYMRQHHRGVQPTHERANEDSPVDSALRGDQLYLCLQELHGSAELAKVKAVSKDWRSQAARVAFTSDYWLRSMSFEELLRTGAPEPVLLRALHSDSDHAFEFMELYAHADNTPRQINPELDDALDRAPALMRNSAPWWITRAKAEEMAKTLANNQLRQASQPSSHVPSAVVIATNLDPEADWSVDRPTKWTWLGWTAAPYRSMHTFLAERLVQAIGFVVSVRVRCVPHALNSAHSDFDGRSFDASTAYTVGTIAVLWTRDRRQLIALRVTTRSEAVLLELPYDDARDLRGHLGNGWVAVGPDAPIVEICTSTPSPSSEQGTLDAYCKILVKNGSTCQTFHAGILGDAQHKHRFRYANGGEKWRKPMRPYHLVRITGGGIQYR
jgi:hypothetical protein